MMNENTIYIILKIMEPLHLLVFAFVAFAITYILGASDLSLGMRRWLKGRSIVTSEYRVAPGISTYTVTNPFSRFLITLIECPACLGFHVSFWCVGGVLGVFSDLNLGACTLIAFIAGCFTITSNLILSQLIGWTND